MKRQTINLLLLMKKGKPFFISSQRNPPERSGKYTLPGPLVDLKTKILEYYSSIKERFDPHETVCTTLYFADDLVILHPQGIPEGESKRILEDFLYRSEKKHTVWMILDAILAMMGIPLAFLPGPNLFFYYPAARAVSHYFARRGVIRAKNLEKMSFAENASIDIMQENMSRPESVRPEIERLEEEYGFTHIERLIHLSGK